MSARAKIPSFLLALLVGIAGAAGAAPADPEDSFSGGMSPGLVFQRGGQPPAELLPANAVTNGADLGCGHMARHVARATEAQMTCIRGLLGDFIRDRGGAHFPEDTCDLRALYLLGRMRAACGYDGAYLMIYNREGQGSGGLEPGVRGATYASVEWGAHWVPGVVDERGECWSLDPVLGRARGGVVPLADHLAMTDSRGRAGLAQVSRWNGRTLDAGGQSHLCMADCLGNFNRQLREFEAAADIEANSAVDRLRALDECRECRQECGRRHGEAEFRFFCEQVFRPRPRRSDQSRD